MFLRSTTQLLLNIPCRHPPVCSLLRIIGREKLFSSSSYAFLFYRPFTHSVSSCYQKKDPGKAYHSKVDADEFHKLPPKCSACGAILQTQQHKHRGYIDKTNFINLIKNRGYDKAVCINCYQLRYHNSPVIPGISSKDAMHEVRHLRQRKALVLYVVDLLDIEGTMLQNIQEVVGENKVLLVGNKIDLIPKDQRRYPCKQIDAMTDALVEICLKNGLGGCNFKDVGLVSAETGFALQRLLQKVMKHRDYGMDVYLVGCTNTGKSTLYNLLTNMLNVHKSGELPEQAIVHHTPGATSTLLREIISERRLERLEMRLERGPWQHTEELGDDENERCFLYDTPGISNDSQIVQHLTSSEIDHLSPGIRWIIPKTFILKPGTSLALGGLARLDFISIVQTPSTEKDFNTVKDAGDSMPESILSSGKSIYVTTMVSHNVPLHATITETAGEELQKLFSNNVLDLTPGSSEGFPELKGCKYTLSGNGEDINACDLVLHGIGWVSISAALGSQVSVVLHTPNGKGQGLRLPPLLPNTVQQKKGRFPINRYMYMYPTTSSLHFIKLLDHQNHIVRSWQVKVKSKLDSRQGEDQDG